MQIEVGKTYRDRRGELVKIVDSDHSLNFPFYGDTEDTYRPDGRFAFGAMHPRDLIGEVSVGATPSVQPTYKPIDLSTQRKATPLWSGVLRYFPDALAAVARLSKAGNDKHNSGQPLHWSRGKSNDHGDCLVRHQMTPEAIDPDTGESHATAVAWRALAQLQLLEEARLGKTPE